MAGRHSTASLEFAPPPKDGRLEPPAGLGALECEVWVSIVASKPAEWFTSDTVALLEGYCCAVVRGRWLEEKLKVAQADLDNIDPYDADGMKLAMNTYHKFHEWAQRNLSSLQSVATKLRLTPQARYDTRVAATANARIAGEKKPWEMDEVAGIVLADVLGEGRA